MIIFLHFKEAPSYTPAGGGHALSPFYNIGPLGSQKSKFT